MTAESESRKLVGGLSLDAAAPTPVAMDQLFDWVIWQYPRRKAQGYCGAVRPPSGGWYPAIVANDHQKVLIYGHVSELFASPEAASRHLDSLTAA